MTDQEIIKALRNKHCDESCPMAGKCYDGLDAKYEVCNFVVLAAADRLEELTASRNVMKMKEDA